MGDTKIFLEISERIRNTLRESRQGGWTTKQVNDLIVNESGIHYHYTHVDPRTNGALNNSTKEGYM